MVLELHRFSVVKCLWASALIACSTACTGNIDVNPGTDVLGSGDGYVPRDAITNPDQLSDEACEANPPAPGRTTMRRLNRAEYNNTLRDLLGETDFPADAFPADDYGYGFDNIGDVLAVGTLYIEKHEQAVEASVLNTLADPDRQTLVLACDPAAPNCIEDSIRAFARRAWRRPVSEEEVAQLLAIQQIATTEGLSRLEAFGLSMQGVLLSPNFIYLVEENLGVRALSSHELATRLSYFLWSSLPDAELDTLADAGSLTDDVVLSAQVQRMLVDPKAFAFFENFTGQWLELRALTETSKDSALFPEFDGALRDSMTKQGVAFMKHLLDTGADVQDVLMSENVMLDQALASLHGINPESYSDTPVPVQMDHARMGVLTLDGVLTAMSHPNETSPVKRGKWVLDVILCDSPPPPPPDVEGIDPKIDPDLPTREKIEQHRADPACAGCHMLMDPLGFGLENYDPLGRWRDNYPTGEAIDASGQLPDESTFESGTEMAALIAADKRLSSCVTEKLMTYALGRGIEAADTCSKRSIIDFASHASGVSLRQLIVGIIMSDAFRMDGGLTVEVKP